MKFNQAILDHFLTLDSGNAIQAEYIWIGGKQEIRSKTRTIFKVPENASELPSWNYDGSSTWQASGEDSEVTLVPRAVFKDPFRKGNHILVLCDTYDAQGNPLATNTRAAANQFFANHLEEEPWYGLEQEYVMFSTKTGNPLGWPKHGAPKEAQGPYYCSNGADVQVGRAIVEAHYRACLYAGVKISGCNAEVMLGQWEFQVGPCVGIEAGDHLWIARFLLLRIGEMFNVSISFSPKPMPNWNGSGCHANFSTKKMRGHDGLVHIYESINKLKETHHAHIQLYGEGNEHRLTGKFETASMNEFTYGVANRGASVRIPRETVKNERGYFEDRRPAANCDPYVVTHMLLKSTLYA